MSVNSTMFKALNISRRSKIPVLLLSQPGGGKTTSVYKYAELHNFKVTELRGSTSSPEDILGYYVNEGEEYLKVKYPEWFIKILEDDKIDQPHLLFLDEITTVSKATQAALLKLIFDREIHGKKLPTSCIIVSAGNYAANLAHGFGMLAPTLNRFCIVNLTPKEQDYIDFIYENMNKSTSLIYPSEFKTVNKEKVEDALANGFKYLVKKFNKSISSKQKTLIINLANKDYTAVDGCDTDIYGIMTPRTISYLKRMIIACIELNYKIDVDFVPLGLIGFGTGEVVDTNVLMPYHKEILLLFYNIVNETSAAKELDVSILNKVIKEAQDMINAKSDDAFGYISLTSRTKEAFVALNEKVGYLELSKEKELELSNVVKEFYKVFKDLSKLIEANTINLAKAHKTVYNSDMHVIAQTIDSSKIADVLKNNKITREDDKLLLKVN